MPVARETAAATSSRVSSGRVPASGGASRAVASLRRHRVQLARERLGPLVVLGVDGDVAGPGELLEPLLQPDRRPGHRCGRPQPDPGGRAVDQVDRLVRQEPVAHVAVGQHRRRVQCRVGDHDAVVALVALPQPPQDRHGLLHRRLRHPDRLEPPLQRRVALDVAAVLAQRRRPDHLQLAPGQCRLEDRAGVHRAALGRARPDHGVQLVDEHHHRPPRRHHLVDHRGEPLLELAAVLRAGDHAGEIQGHHAQVPQALGHLTRDDARRDALHDRGLAHPRVAQQHGVVLGPPRQDLQDGVDLLGAPHHRVQGTLARGRGEIAAVAVQPRCRHPAAGPCALGSGAWGSGARGGASLVVPQPLLQPGDEPADEILERPERPAERLVVLAGRLVGHDALPLYALPAHLHRPHQRWCLSAARRAAFTPGRDGSDANPSQPPALRP